MDVVEVDIDQLSDADRGALIAFEQTMWAEHAMDEPPMAEEPALWLAKQRYPNATRATWVVRAAAGELAGVAALHLPFADNQHLGYVELRVAPSYRRQGIGHALLAAVADARQGGAPAHARRLLLGSRRAR